MTDKDLATIWTTVLAEIEVELGKANFNLFFKNSQLLSFDNGIANIGFSNKVVSDQVNQRYYTIVQHALQQATKTDKISLTFETITVNHPQVAVDIGPLFTVPREDKEAISEAVKRAHLRPDFSLDNFCVSTSNQLAFAAAQAVIKNPGANYNPLFLWGGVGVGKTHLMQAIGHEIIRQNPQARVVFAPGEQFTNEIIQGIRTKNTQDFRSKYRTADALLIDDIQFFSGKDTAQEEFFHTFNNIQQNGGQIIMTSDRKPADIKDLADRLRSRFEGGMVADISTPDSELKTAICQLKAKKRGLELSTEAAAAIAGSVDNIRSLEGALQKIIIAAGSDPQPLTPDSITTVLGLPTTADQPQISRIDGRLVLDLVCNYYSLPIKLIKGEKRDRLFSQPRQILMYLLRKNTTMTLIEIGDFLGGKDHTTILHGAQKIERLLATNTQLKTDVDKLEKMLISGPSQ